MGVAGSVLDDEMMQNSPQPQRRVNSNKSEQKDAPGGAEYPQFPVSLGFWPGNKIKLPDQFLLRIAYESLDFVRQENGAPLVQFPFQNIICWGSTPQNFQFKIFDLEKEEVEKRDAGILISLKTNQGKKIEEATMSTVQKLMLDINSRAISKPEFKSLLDNLFDEDGKLQDSWLPVIDQFTAGGRLFLAKQGMELLFRVGSQAPFEKVELTCLIYERMINKNSVQLLINTFEDQQERDNLIHRLKLHKGQVVVNDCSILPERAKEPETV